MSTMDLAWRLEVNAGEVKGTGEDSMVFNPITSDRPGQGGRGLPGLQPAPPNREVALKTLHPFPDRPLYRACGGLRVISLDELVRNSQLCLIVVRVIDAVRRARRRLRSAHARSPVRRRMRPRNVRPGEENQLRSGPRSRRARSFEWLPEGGSALRAAIDGSRAGTIQAGHAAVGSRLAGRGLA